jgi:hypothetical protein
MSRDDTIDLGKALERLESNPDFRLLQEAYMIQLPLEIVDMYEDSTEQREQLLGIKQFKDWFTQQINNAKIMMKDK